MRSKGSRLPRYVYKQVVKGRTYYRCRKGGNTVRLPGDPGSSEFHAAYARLIAAPHAKMGRYEPGSVAHTVDLYFRSAEFSQLAAGTQRDYRRYLVRLDRAVGERAIDSLDSDFIFQLRDRLQRTPSAANHAVAVIGTLFQFAVKRKIVPTDITASVERLKGGDGYRRWPDADIQTFLASDKVGERMKLALMLGLYLGQRLSDVIRLAWSNYDGERMRFRQQKTKTHLVIKVHDALKDRLDVEPRRELVILTTRTGLPYHPRVFSRDFLDARKAAGLPSDLCFHGLRHTTASILAELGAGAPEIQAITGHKSLKQVEHYISQANQERLGDRAIARLPGR